MSKANMKTLLTITKSICVNMFTFLMNKHLGLGFESHVSVSLRETARLSSKWLHRPMFPPATYEVPVASILSNTW